MQVIDLKLAGLKLILPRLFKDERGFFFESYHQSLYESHGLPLFLQDNVSFSRNGALRGLHFQVEPGQDKLVTCTQGAIWDVVVDLRPHSSTFKQWEAVELNDQTHAQLFVPKGFAHGFCVLSESARVHYKVSSFYNPKTERSIRWNDPEFKIAWPITSPILSERDQTSPFFKEIQDVVDTRS